MPEGDWQPGDEAQSLYPADGQWYNCTIQRVNHDGTYKVHWDDFQSFSRVTDSNVKSREAKPDPLKEAMYFGMDPGTMTYSHSLEAVKQLEMQQAVADAKKRGEKVDLSILEPAMKKRKLNTGATARAEINKRFWDDEDFRHIQFLNLDGQLAEYPGDPALQAECDKKAANGTDGVSEDSGKRGPLRTTFEDVPLGCKVDALWPDDGYWYPGEIIEVFEKEGKVKVQYFGFDDLDDRMLYPSYCRRRDSLYPPGVPVQARWVNGAYYDGGVIHGINEDQTYEIFWPQFNSFSHEVPIEDLQPSSYPSSYALIYPNALKTHLGNWAGNQSFAWTPESDAFVPSKRYKRHPRSRSAVLDKSTQLCGVSYVAPSEEKGIQHPVYRSKQLSPDSIPAPTRVKAKLSLEALKKQIMLLTRIAYNKQTDGSKLRAIHNVRKNYLFNPNMREGLINDHDAQEFTGPGFMNVMEQLDSEIFLCIHLLWQNGEVVAVPGAMVDRLGVFKKSNVQLTLLATKENKPMSERNFVSTKPLMAVRLEYVLQHTSFVKLTSDEKQYLQALAEETAAYFNATVLPKYNKSAAALRTAELTSDRDTYSHIVCPKSQTIKGDRVAFVKTSISFNSKNLPGPYIRWIKEQNQLRFAERKPALEPTGKCGASLFTGVFSSPELDWVQSKVDGLAKMRKEGSLKPMTTHVVVKGGKARRVRMFFGARPLWTQDQLQRKDSNVAAGCRVDVDPLPNWIARRMVSRLVACGVVEKGYINAVQLDIFTDGSMGTENRLPCSSKIGRPFAAIQLFSASRYSLGTQGRHQENALAFIPLPRGGVLQFQKDSFFSDGIEHCMRSYDLSVKAATMLFYHYHDDCLQEANEYRDWQRANDVITEGELKGGKEMQLPEGMQW